MPHDLGDVRVANAVYALADGQGLLELLSALGVLAQLVVQRPQVAKSLTSSNMSRRVEKGDDVRWQL